MSAELVPARRARRSEPGIDRRQVAKGTTQAAVAVADTFTGGLFTLALMGADVNIHLGRLPAKKAFELGLRITDRQIESAAQAGNFHKAQRLMERRAKIKFVNG